MKKIFISFILLLLNSYLISQIIVIDPGHGYCADGTQNCVSANSRRLDLEILTAESVGNKLKVLLDNNCSGVTTFMTRPTSNPGDFPGLTQRATMSNNWGADRFLSIHTNGATPAANGTESFWCNQGASSNSACQAFSDLIQSKIVAAGSFTDRRSMEDDSYLNFHLAVLRQVNAINCLSEIGFGSNTSDAAKLQNDTYRNAFAQAYLEVFETSLGISCTGSTPPVLDCSNAVSLTCGVPYSGASSSAPSNIYSYGCNNWSETGPERVHTITPSGSGTLTATVSNFTGDLDVYILGSCDPSDCLGTVSGVSSTLTNAIAGQTYYIVVDADDGSGSSYDLVVNCPPVPLSLDCSNPVNLTCGVPYSGISSSATSNVSTYGCNGSNQTGPERVHTITPISNGSITAVVSNFSGDLDVFLLGSCDPSDCLGIVFQDSVIYANVTGGQTYYIVVDSDNGSGSSYDLIVKCQAQPGSNEDVTVSNASVSPTVLNAGGVLTTSSQQLYSGDLYTTDINGVTMDYYLSTDCNFSADDVYLGGSNSSLGIDNPSSTESINVGIPSTTPPGNYFILFIGDNGQDVVENNETNNSSCIAITVNGATGINDVSLSNVSINVDSIVAGQAIDVSATMNYSGNQTSNNLPIVELNYYLSTDCSLSTDDTFLGDDAATLGSDATSSSEVESLIIPINTESGQYYILFVSDDNDAINESNENNNIECIMIYIDGDFVSINEKDLLHNISVFPNPTSGIITINSENINIKSVEIFNNLGLKLDNLNQTKNNIDLTNYADGLYYVRIIGNNEENTTFKVIKE